MYNVEWSLRLYLVNIIVYIVDDIAIYLDYPTDHHIDVYQTEPQRRYITILS